MKTRRTTEITSAVVTALFASTSMVTSSAYASQSFQVLGSGATVRDRLISQSSPSTEQLYLADNHAREEKSSEGKCGEGKCGDEKKAHEKSSEGKCGEGKCGDEKKAHEKSSEGKCGEGKCGDEKKADDNRGKR